MFVRLCSCFVLLDYFLGAIFCVKARWHLKSDFLKDLFHLLYRFLAVKMLESVALI